MHSTVAFLIAATLLGDASTSLAQLPRNLSGVWKTPSDTLVGQPVPRPGAVGIGGKGKSTLTIDQSKDSLIITGGTVRSAYALDGSRTANYINEGDGHTPVQSRAHWEGNELVLVDTYELHSGLTMFVTNRLSVDANCNFSCVSGWCRGSG